MKRFVLFVALCAVLLTSVRLLAQEQTPAMPAATAASVGNLTPDQVRQVVRDLLISEPQLVVNALQKAQADEQVKLNQKRLDMAKLRKKELMNDPDAAVVGNPKGKLTIVEFYDYNCGHCKTLAPMLSRVVKEDGDIRLILREMPIFGAASNLAAKASLAAVRQGKMLEFHLALMALKQPLDELVIYDTAAKAGLDVERLKRDVADPAIAAALDRSVALTRDLNISGTPFLLVGDQVIPGEPQEIGLKIAIEQARKKS
jgi:protein-disulfide isomerase